MQPKLCYVPAILEIISFEGVSMDILSASTDPYMVDYYDLSWLE